MKYIILSTFILNHFALAQYDGAIEKFLVCDNSDRTQDLMKNITPYVDKVMKTCEEMDALEKSSDHLLFKRAIFNSNLKDITAKKSDEPGFAKICGSLPTTAVSFSSLDSPLKLNCEQTKFISAKGCGNKDTVVNYCSDFVLNLAGSSSHKLIQTLYKGVQSSYEEFSMSACNELKNLQQDKNRFMDKISLAIYDNHAFFTGIKDSDKIAKKIITLRNLLPKIPSVTTAYSDFENHGTHIFPLTNNYEIDNGKSLDLDVQKVFYIKLVNVFKPTTLSFQASYIQLKKYDSELRAKKRLNFMYQSAYQNALENLNALLTIDQELKDKIKREWIDKLYVFDKKGNVIDVSRELMAQYNVLGFKMENGKVAPEKFKYQTFNELATHLSRIPVFKEAFNAIKTSIKQDEKVASRVVFGIADEIYKEKVAQAKKSCEQEKKQLKELASIDYAMDFNREEIYEETLVKILKSKSMFANTSKICEFVDKSLKIANDCSLILGEFSKTSCGVPNSFSKNELGYLRSMKNSFIASKAMELQMRLLAKALNGVHDGAKIPLASSFNFRPGTIIPTAANMEFKYGARTFNCGQFSNIKEDGLSYEVLHEVAVNLREESEIAFLLSSAPENKYGDIARILIYYALSTQNNDYYMDKNVGIIPTRSVATEPGEKLNYPAHPRELIGYFIRNIHEDYQKNHCQKSKNSPKTLHNCLCSNKFDLKAYHYGNDFRLSCVNKKKEKNKTMKAHHMIVTSDDKTELDKYLGTSYFSEGINLNAKLHHNTIVEPNFTHPELRTYQIDEKKLREAIGEIFYESN